MIWLTLWRFSLHYLGKWMVVIKRIFQVCIGLGRFDPKYSVGAAIVALPHPAQVKGREPSPVLGFVDKGRWEMQYTTLIQRHPMLIMHVIIRKAAAKKLYLFLKAKISLLKNPINTKCNFSISPIRILSCWYFALTTVEINTFVPIVFTLVIF